MLCCSALTFLQYNTAEKRVSAHFHLIEACVCKRERERVDVCEWVSHRQCDRMSRLFVQYLVIYNNENSALWSKNGRSVFKICQIINKPSKNCQRLLKLYQGGKISPNLVTLTHRRRARESEMFKWEMLSVDFERWKEERGALLSDVGRRKKEGRGDAFSQNRDRRNKLYFLASLENPFCLLKMKPDFLKKVSFSKSFCLKMSNCNQRRQLGLRDRN